jgi:predicted Zn-dependent protease
MKKTIMIISFLVFTLTLSVDSFAVDLGKIINASVTGVQKVAEASKDITPAEEHYIGRSVAAVLLSRYPLVENPALTKYLNKVGLLVAYSSERPDTYGGYHFGVVRNNEINAYACPGGFIFVTTGLLSEVGNEDQLAAVLGHEVAHVAHRDGINSIKKSRWTDLGFYAAGQAAGQFSPAEVKELTNVFTGVISEVGKTVIENGYSQSQEKNADEAGVRYAAAAGYDPSGLIALLQEEIQKNLSSGGGPYSSHPKPDTRIRLIKEEIQKEGLGREIAQVRTNRYKTAMASR